LSLVVWHIRKLAGDDNRSDRQLLHRFASQREEAAFEMLVARHGPAIIGLCRRLLRHEQDAEDVFQATFLTLARKASSIRKPESLGCEHNYGSADSGIRGVLNDPITGLQ